MLQISNRVGEGGQEKKIEIYVTYLFESPLTSLRHLNNTTQSTYHGHDFEFLLCDRAGLVHLLDGQIRHRWHSITCATEVVEVTDQGLSTMNDDKLTW